MSAVISRACLLTLLLCAAACSRTPPAQYYLLSAPPGAASAKALEGPRLGLGPIRLPEYLDRPQIVSWANDTRLNLSNRHRWAEPLRDSFARSLQAQLALALPTTQIIPYPWRGAPPPPRQITVDVQRFERAADGTMRLSARWTVQQRAADATPRVLLTDLSLPVGGAADDYDALVAAASAAVGALAQDIARRLPAD